MCYQSTSCQESTIYYISIFDLNAQPEIQTLKWYKLQCAEVRFSSFLSGGFITAIVNPPQRKLEKTHPCAMVTDCGSIKSLSMTIVSTGYCCTLSKAIWFPIDFCCPLENPQLRVSGKRRPKLNKQCRARWKISEWFRHCKVAGFWPRGHSRGPRNHFDV